jgi:ABC-type phosphate transport system substrate-binding protein
VVNLDEIGEGQIHFSSQLLADIYLGKVTNWRDPAIAGNFVPPNMSSFQAAVADLDWTEVRGFGISLTDASRADAYPIIAASFALIRIAPDIKGPPLSRRGSQPPG